MKRKGSESPNNAETSPKTTESGLNQETPKAEKRREKKKLRKASKSISKMNDEETNSRQVSKKNYQINAEFNQQPRLIKEKEKQDKQHPR